MNHKPLPVSKSSLGKFSGGPKVHTRTMAEKGGTIRAIENNVFIEIEEADIISKAGIYVPGKKDEKAMIGTVVSVGPGKWHPQTQTYLPTGVKPGDVVLFGQYSGTEMDFDGKRYRTLEAHELCGIVEDYEP